MKLSKFERWKSDERSWEEFFHRVADGETVQEFCASKSIAYSLVAKHIAQTPLLKSQYDTALQLRGDALAQETIEIVDDANAETVSVAKLRAETRFRMAGKLDRERYGERERPAVSVNISLGDVTREIRELESRLGIGLAAPLTIEQLPDQQPARAVPYTELEKI